MTKVDGKRIDIFSDVPAAEEGGFRIDSSGDAYYNNGSSEVRLRMHPDALDIVTDTPISLPGGFRVSTGGNLFYHDGGGEVQLFIGGIGIVTASWVGTSTGQITIPHGAGFSPNAMIAHLGHSINSGTSPGQSSCMGVWQFNGGSPIQRSQTASPSFQNNSDVGFIALNGGPIIGNHAVLTHVDSVSDTSIVINRTNIGTEFLNSTHVFTLTLTIFS